MEKERDQIYSKFLQVSKETGLPVKKVLDVFFVLSSGEPVDNNELLKRVGVSKNVLNQVKRSLLQFLEPVSKQTQVSPDGLKQIKRLYEGEYTSEEQLWTLLEDNHYHQVVSLLGNIQDSRPKSKREYDQFQATIETTARRASLLHYFGDIREKRLLFLGDDDFTSVATASYGLADRIAVLDIDERILDEISQVSQGQHTRIETLKYDARNKLPEDLVGKFDVVFTDPPYTPNGTKLFVSRAVELLDQSNKAARVYVCYGNSDRAKERFLPVQSIFVDLGLMTRWVFDKFNRYQGAESIGSSSSLFVAEVTPKTKPAINGKYENPIYTNN